MPVLKKKGILVMAALAAVVMTGFASTAAVALEKVRLLIPIRAIDESYSPVVVAKEKGYFAEEGYDVSVLAVGGSNEAAIQVSAGNGDVGAASPGEALVGIQSGKLNIRYFYDLYYSSIWSVKVLPDSPVKTLADLKGKRIGVQSMGSAGVTFGRAFVKEAGLDPQADITFMPIGIGAQAIASIKQNLVDAVVYWDAALAKLAFSGLELRDVPVPGNIKTLPDVSLLARPETIEKNPKMVIGIARAIAKGYDFTMANPEAAVLMTWKAYPESRSKNPDPAAALREGVAVNQGRLSIWSSPKTGDQHGKFIAEDWERLVTFLQEQKILAGSVPVDRIFTNDFIGEINKYDRDAIISAAKKEDLSKLR